MKKLVTTISILFIATVGYAQTYTIERVVDGETARFDLAQDFPIDELTTDTVEWIDKNFPVPPDLDKSIVEVERVIDGDTIAVITFDVEVPGDTRLNPI